MASVNISESDFTAAATGAHALKRSGDVAGAEALDKLARKINAALSNQTARNMTPPGFPRGTALTWRNVPSVFRDDDHA